MSNKEEKALRKCRHCGLEAKEEKELHLFDKDKNKPYGRSTICKECSINVDGRKKHLKIIENKTKLIKMLGGECEDCNIKANKQNYVIFDFHHINPEDKEFEVSRKLKHIDLSEEIIKEAKKCVVLCSNCHRMRHSKEYIIQEKEV